MDTGILIMPIEIEQVQSDLYVLRWRGHVLLEEIRDSHEKTFKIAQEAAITHYIHILLLAEMKTFPYDAVGLWKIMHDYPQSFAVLVVDAPPISLPVIRLLNQMIQDTLLESFDTLQQAQQRAEELLAKYRR